MKYFKIILCIGFVLPPNRFENSAVVLQIAIICLLFLHLDCKIIVLCLLLFD